MGRKLLQLFCLQVFILLTISTSGWARHIVGGELAFKPTETTNRYEVTMIQYWDENTLTNMNRDQTAEVLIYRKRDNRLMDRTLISFLSSRSITYQNRACAAFRSLRTLEGTYQGYVTLNSASYNDPDGYYLIWERCCRNDDINNIQDPGSNGMTFYLEIPPLTLLNASPRFQSPNGTYICIDQPFELNMGATDRDGDELRYSLVVPLRGNTSRNFPIGDDRPKQGYPSVAWAAGVSLGNVIPGNPSLKINQATGELSVKAQSLGLYVFAIQCEEFRNGKKIGAVRRDFQLLVIECSEVAPPESTVTYNNAPAFKVEFCPEKPIQLATSESSDWAYQWQLNGQNINGATTARITVRDTGSYTVVKSFRTICSRDSTSQAVKVSFGTPPLAVISTPADIFCVGQNVELTANDGNRTPGYLYGWKKGNSPIGDNSPRYTASTAGTYFLNVTIETNGCQAKDSLTVKEESILATLPDRLSMQFGNTIPLEPALESSSMDLTFLWTPGTGLSSTTERAPFTSPSETTTYTLYVTTALGCKAEARVQVIVFDKLYIPDAFSPNGDGVNDQFEIRNARLQVEEVQIFNRWGEIVYYSKEYSSPWDGYYKGKVVAPGGYTYIIKTPFHTYKGQIQVLF
ncbi:gliding motility-associated C-terminal domain-containing protein [Telluribacter sp.]|jgi:gliding motility-associated-like protein|uniref:gliding motility-associated C-terminal domain-containing protein n=1 Tax=Telluribacter sp. TaxID=1978767 RepID=UPI002E12F864|nr:gliding motility-associated C-terminal domain-containing protein [Telluribacter sp.]